MGFTYEEALAYIASFAPRGWRLGLDRMQELAERAEVGDYLGERGPKFVHVAGTNGKGSVTAFVQSILTEQGYRVGGFFSPYVYDPRERVQLNGQLIAKSDFARLTSELAPIADELSATEFGPVTEFEFKTALGLKYWKEQGCEWVALEVGLGGRLDATNIATPAVSVITSISLDHTSILGETLEAIAREKAGILKPGKPAVVGKLPPGALEAIEDVALSLGCPLLRLGCEFHIEGETVVTPLASHGILNPGIKGPTQMQNAATALVAVEAAGGLRDPSAACRGIEKAWLPGRMQRVRALNRAWLLDGAHNYEAAAHLASALRAEGGGRKIIMVTNMVDGHDPRLFYQEFRELEPRVHVAPIDFRRALPVAATEKALREVGITDVLTHETLEGAVAAAVRDAAGGEPIIVCGSFYLVGEVGRALGITDT